MCAAVRETLGAGSGLRLPPQNAARPTVINAATMRALSRATRPFFMYSTIRVEVVADHS
jgi:hypothetical protein